MFNTEFVSDIVSYAESFVDIVINHPQGTDKFEEQIQKAINNLTPEEQSNLLFMLGMFIVQLSQAVPYENRTAIGTALSIVRTMNEEYAKIKGGNFVRALTFGIIQPLLSGNTKEKKEEPVQ